MLIGPESINHTPEYLNLMGVPQSCTNCAGGNRAMGTLLSKAHKKRLRVIIFKPRREYSQDQQRAE